MSTWSGPLLFWEPSQPLNDCSQREWVSRVKASDVDAPINRMGSFARVRAISSDDDANQVRDSAANSFTKAPGKLKKQEVSAGTVREAAHSSSLWKDSKAPAFELPGLWFARESCKPSP